MQNILRIMIMRREIVETEAQRLGYAVTLEQFGIESKMVGLRANWPMCYPD